MARRAAKREIPLPVTTQRVCGPSAFNFQLFDLFSAPSVNSVLPSLFLCKSLRSAFTPTRSGRPCASLFFPSFFSYLCLENSFPNSPLPLRPLCYLCVKALFFLALREETIWLFHQSIPC